MKTEEKLPDTVRKILVSDLDVDSYPLDFDKETEKTKIRTCCFPKK